jgi:branched-chain amino acid transport system substrate-binding protein
MCPKAKLLVLIVALLVVALLAGCPKPAEQVDEGAGQIHPEGPQLEPTGDPIKIGAIFSVTGPSAPLGEPEKLTAEMLAEQINSAGGVLGRPVEVIVKDDKSEPTEAALAAKDLINTEKVVAIIGPSTTPTTMAIVDICEQANIPLISCAAGAPITNPVKKWVFAVPQTDIIAVAKIIDYLKAKKITKVASIYVSNGYGESGQKQIEEQLPAAGIELVTSESFGGEDTDMTAQVTRIKGKNPEAVICWGTNPGPATVARNMQTLGLDVPLLQSHGVANAKFIELAGDAANGVMLPAGRLIVESEIAADDKQKEVLSRYATDYTAKSGKPVDTFGGHAFDAFHILCDAIAAAGNTEAAAVRDAIEATKEFVGTAGIFTYTPEDHNGLTKDAFVWVKIVDGKWKLAEDEINS